MHQAETGEFRSMVIILRRLYNLEGKAQMRLSIAYCNHALKITFDIFDSGKIISII